MRISAKARLLATTEIALGTALLIPVIPAAVAGAGLAAFSGGLLGLYAKTPGMRKENSPFPESARDGAGQGRLDDRHRPRPSHR
jgi:hypothetical protein